MDMGLSVVHVERLQEMSPARSRGDHREGWRPLLLAVFQHTLLNLPVLHREVAAGHRAHWTELERAGLVPRGTWAGLPPWLPTGLSITSASHQFFSFIR